MGLWTLLTGTAGLRRMGIGGRSGRAQLGRMLVEWKSEVEY